MFDLTDVGYVHRIVVGSINPEQLQRGRDSRFANLDGPGPPLPPDARGSATLRLPLLGLRRLSQPQVTGFSFEVDVEIELERGRYADGHPRMRLLID